MIVFAITPLHPTIAQQIRSTPICLAPYQAFTADETAHKPQAADPYPPWCSAGSSIDFHAPKALESFLYLHHFLEGVLQNCSLL